MAKTRKPRNWLAVRAHFRTGAGVHGNKVPRSAIRNVWLDEWWDELEDEETTVQSGSYRKCNAGDDVVE